jgi:hypothetical protein
MPLWEWEQGKAVLRLYTEALAPPRSTVRTLEQPRPRAISAGANRMTKTRATVASFSLTKKWGAAATTQPRRRRRAPTLRRPSWRPAPSPVADGSSAPILSTATPPAPSVPRRRG